MKVSVSYLSSNSRKEETIRKINDTQADYLHVDLMDGKFAGEKNYELDELVDLLKISNKPLDVHLMVNDPSLLIDTLIPLKPWCITIPQEIEKKEEYLKKIKDSNIRCGLAFNPDTEIDDLVEDIDLVLVMSVNPGKGGQAFIDVTNKLEQLKKIQKNYSFVISVDGGINEESIDKVKDYVDMVVSGSYVCKSDNYEAQIQTLKKVEKN